jgi:hypothetical protein
MTLIDRYRPSVYRSETLRAQSLSGIAPFFPTNTATTCGVRATEFATVLAAPLHEVVRL